MKNQNTRSVLSALTLTFGIVLCTATRSHAQIESLNGTWEVVARVCEPSGNPGSDAFVRGRDSLILAIKMENNRLRVLTTIENKKWVDDWEITRQSENVYLINPLTKQNGKTPGLVTIEQTPYHTLVLTTSGFGEGGTCRRGESLKSYFRRSAK